MARCLYCREEKSAELFNREHVIPQAFGTFADNLVLHEVVCSDCNRYFSQHLELYLGRDSMEGFQRYDAGVASPDRIQKFGGNRLRCRWRGGEMEGALMEWRSDGRALCVFVVDQIGCSTSPDGKREWYPMADFPTRETLVASGLVRGAAYFMICGESGDVYSRGRQILKERGYNLDPPEAPEPSLVLPDSMVPLSIYGTVDGVLLRAIAKIAVNYFAYHYPAIAQMDAFSVIRRLVRYGDPSGADFVSVARASILGGVPEDRQLLVHTVTASWHPTRHEVVGQVSLFSWLQYQVVLGRGFRIAPEFVETGHLFDPINKAILPIARASRAAQMRPPPMVEKRREDEAI